MNAFIALTLMAFLGCGVVRTKVAYEDAALPAETTRQLIPGTTRYDAEATLAGTNLLLKVSRAQECRVTRVSRARRQATVVRTAGSPGGAKLIATDLFWAVVAGGLGALFLRDGINDDCSSNDGMGSPNDSSSVCYGLGALFSVGGVALGATAVVEAHRLRDTSRDEGVVETERSVRQVTCSREPAGMAAIALRLTGDVEVRGVTAADGSVTLSLLSVPESGLSGAPELVVNGKRGSLRLPNAIWAEAVAELSNVAHSRLARDQAIQHAPDEIVHEDVEAALSRGEVKTACQLVSVHEEIVPALRADSTTKHLLDKVLVDAAFVIVSGKGDIAAGRSALCYVRRLYTELYESPAWHDALARVARNAAELFSLTDAEAARRLDSPGC